LSQERLTLAAPFLEIRPGARWWRPASALRSAETLSGDGFAVSGSLILRLSRKGVGRCGVRSL